MAHPRPAAWFGCANPGPDRLWRLVQHQHPDADSATRVPEWEETVEFTVDWPDPHLVEVPVEKCEWVEFHLTAPVDVTARFHNPDGETGGNWGLVDDLHTVKMAEATGIWTLEVTNKFGRTTPTNVTVSWLVQPPRFEC